MQNEPLTVAEVRQRVLDMAPRRDRGPYNRGKEALRRWRQRQRDDANREALERAAAVMP